MPVVPVVVIRREVAEGGLVHCLVERTLRLKLKSCENIFRFIYLNFVYISGVAFHMIWRGRRRFSEKDEEAKNVNTEHSKDSLI